jgi:hypothetical protein
MALLSFSSRAESMLFLRGVLDLSYFWGRRFCGLFCLGLESLSERTIISIGEGYWSCGFSVVVFFCSTFKVKESRELLG